MRDLHRFRKENYLQNLNSVLIKEYWYLFRSVRQGVIGNRKMVLEASLNCTKKH